MPNKTIEINENCNALVNGANSNRAGNRDIILKIENEKYLEITYEKVMDTRLVK